MQNAWLDEAQAGIKIARRNINILRYADDTTLRAESKEKLKSLLSAGGCGRRTKRSTSAAERRYPTSEVKGSGLECQAATAEDGREELHSLLMKVKEESWKSWLKSQHEKTNIMTPGPITLWQVDGENVGGKRHLLLGRIAKENLDSV